MPPKKKPPTLKGWRKYWAMVPPSNHGLWSLLRLLVLVVGLKWNATNFDMTEGNTIIAMAFAELIGLRKRS